MPQKEEIARLAMMGLSSAEYVEYGTKFHDAGELGSAEAVCCLAIRADPKNVQAYRMRAFIYNALEQYDKAIADCTEGIRLDPDHIALYYCRGSVYLILKQNDKALADFIDIIDMEPNQALAYNLRGTAYQRLDLQDKAIVDYTKAIRLDPEYADAYNNRGFSYFRLNLYDKAIVDYTEAIKINPNDGIVHAGLASAYDNLNQSDKALAGYLRCVQLYPEAPNHIYTRIAELRVQQAVKEELAKERSATDYFNRRMVYNPPKQASHGDMLREVRKMDYEIMERAAPLIERAGLKWRGLYQPFLEQIDDYDLTAAYHDPASADWDELERLRNMMRWQIDVMIEHEHD